METDATKTSKFLSFVLRHKPESIEIELDPAGWTEIERLLSASLKHNNPVSMDELRAVVETNDKKRFEISECGRFIRASQGHSVKVELGYEAKTPPEILYHGTASRFVEPIKLSGLQKLARHHVHLSQSQTTASAVGSRYGKTVLLKISASEMHVAGHIFYQSSNGVWLTDHVPVEFIQFPQD